MYAWRPSHWLGSLPVRIAPRGSASPGRPPRRPAVETLEDRVTPAIVGSPHQNYVAQVYQDLVHQTIDVGTLASATDFLNRGGGVLDVVNQIQKGTPYRHFEIDSAVHALLHRNTDPFWNSTGFSILQSGGTLEQFETLLLDSNEYFQRNGGTNDGWLSGVYRDLELLKLSAAATPPGDPVPVAARQGWDEVFAAGFSRFTVAALIVYGLPKFQIDVTGQFDALLHRKPSADELAFWTGVERRAGIDAVIAGLATTREYFVDAQVHPPVVPGRTATRLTLTSNLPASNLGQDVTFTATVGPARNALYVAGGTVTFRDGNTTLTTIPVGPGGSAVLKTPGLTGGSHVITASYSGDANFTPSGAQLTQTVSQGQSSIQLISLSPGVKEGTPVQLQATLNGGSAGPVTPTGTVTFYELVGGTRQVLGSVPINGLTVQDSFNLAAGDYLLTASYSGDASYTGSDSTPPIAQRVNLATAATPSVTVTTSATNNTSQLGQAVTFTAVVSPPTGVPFTPTGVVTFRDANGIQLGSKVPLDAQGRAVSDPVNTLPGGTDKVTAVYDPGNDANFSGASNFVNLTVQPVDVASITVVNDLGNNPSALGELVRFKATVTPPTFPAGVSFIPTGTVDFLASGVVIGSGQLTLAGGTATATYTTTASQLPAGANSITAVYRSDNNFKTKTSAAITQTVNTADTHTSVTGLNSPNGGAITLTISVTSTNNGNFSKDGSQKVRVNLTNQRTGITEHSLLADVVSGMATVSTTLTDDNYTVDAAYLGNGNFNGSNVTKTLAVVDEDQGKDDDAGAGDMDLHFMLQ